MSIGLGLAVVAALIAANGFFVAAEFGLVTARRTRIEQLAARGSRAAIAVRLAQSEPNRFIAACQLGVTVCSLALGWVGEATIVEIVYPPLEAIVPAQVLGLTAHSIAAPIAFFVMSFVDIVFGELVPKMFALQRGEQAALLTVLPVNVIAVVFRPFIQVLEMTTRMVLRLMGVHWQPENGQAYSAEDLKLMVQASRAAGSLEADPDRLVERALDFAQLAAHHVMVPRTEMIAIPIEIPMLQLAQTMERYQHSRYPVYEETSDNVVGILWAKHIAATLAARPGSIPDVRTQMRPPMFVPETMRADRLLAEMKRARSHEAIVIDEFGSTAGLVTLRDIMDRLAGEVRDQTEMARPAVERLADGTALVDGLTLLSDVGNELGIDFGETEYDTLGGLIFGLLGRRPTLGDSVVAAGRTLIVEELDGLRVARVRITSAAVEEKQPVEPTEAVTS